jgi:hypothetical protein
VYVDIHVVVVQVIVAIATIIQKRPVQEISGVVVARMEEKDHIGLVLKHCWQGRG